MDNRRVPLWIKTVLVAAFAGAALWAIAGCYKTEASLKVHEGGLISSMNVILETKYLEVYNLIKARLLEEAEEYGLSEEELENLGIRFQEDHPPFSISISAPIELVISALEGKADIDVEVGKETVTLQFAIDFTFIEEVEQEFGIDEVSSLIKLYGEPSFALTITMPGEIIEYSHGDASGNTLIWTGKFLELQGWEELIVKSKLPPRRRPPREPMP